METMNRKTFGIRNTTNYMIVPFAKEPVRFTYMTADDRIVPTGASLLNYYDGPKQFRTLETAQKVKATLEWHGIRHTNEVACNFVAVRPNQMEVRIMTVEEFLAFKAN
jgi:hypothetical protein